jgi:Cys-tRNA(Pro)/Cys-tRNA(Cys) deacylase
MASHQEAEKLTGLQVGGISPLLLINKGFDILIDKSAAQHETIFVSGGEKGINLKLPVEALIELTRAKYVGVTGA